VLTYYEYAPRVKMAAALLDGRFEHFLQLTLFTVFLTSRGNGLEIFNIPTSNSGYFTIFFYRRSPIIDIFDSSLYQRTIPDAQVSPAPKAARTIKLPG